MRKPLSLASDAAGRIDKQPDILSGKPIRMHRRAAFIGYVQDVFLDFPKGEVSGAYSVGSSNTINYRFIYIDTRNAIYLTVMIIKRQYDIYYMPIFFQLGDFVKLRLHRGYNILGHKDRNVKIEQ